MTRSRKTAAETPVLGELLEALLPLFFDQPARPDGLHSCASGEPLD